MLKKLILTSVLGLFLFCGIAQARNDIEVTPLGYTGPVGSVGTNNGYWAIDLDGTPLYLYNSSGSLKITSDAAGTTPIDVNMGHILTLYNGASDVATLSGDSLTFSNGTDSWVYNYSAKDLYFAVNGGGSLRMDDNVVIQATNVADVNSYKLTFDAYGGATPPGTTKQSTYLRQRYHATVPYFEIVPDANGDITLSVSGTGEVNIPKIDCDSGAIDDTLIGVTTPNAGNFSSIGATTRGSGLFTTLGANDNVTLSGGSTKTLLLDHSGATADSGVIKLAADNSNTAQEFTIQLIHHVTAPYLDINGPTGGYIDVDKEIKGVKLTIDNIVIDGATITSSTGAISFSDENLSTTGTITMASNSIVQGTSAGIFSVNAATNNNSVVYLQENSNTMSHIGYHATDNEGYMQNNTSLEKSALIDTGGYRHYKDGANPEDYEFRRYISYAELAGGAGATVVYLVNAGLDIIIPSDSVYGITVKIVAHNEVGNETARYIIDAVAQNADGTSTLKGLTATYTYEDDALWDAVLSVSDAATDKFVLTLTPDGTNPTYYTIITTLETLLFD